MKEYKLSGGEALARAVEKRYETVASEYHCFEYSVFSRESY